MVHDLEIQIANLDKGYEKLTSEMFKHGEEWHKEIDVIMTNMKTELYEIKIKQKTFYRSIWMKSNRYNPSLIKQLKL